MSAYKQGAVHFGWGVPTGGGFGSRAAMGAWLHVCPLSLLCLMRPITFPSSLVGEGGVCRRGGWRGGLLVQWDDGCLGRDVGLQGFTGYFSLALVFM